MDKVYDRVVLATAEYELAPEVAEKLRGEKGEKGTDGVGYTDINLQGEELVFHRTDGEDQCVPAPKGKDGEPGKDGVSPPAPNITVGDVTEGEAGATVTGAYPDLKLNLTIPRGAVGPKGDTGSAGPRGERGETGDRGERGETGPKGADAEPLNLAVTASTLSPGAEATAALSGEYPNLTLALGLPAGAKGEQGIGLPGPKGDRGDVTITQQGMVFGEGFPEGKVTATPGTVYTDTAMTNGAIQWVKKSGTGATGWAVTVGDTGWRLFHTQNLDGEDTGNASKFTAGWVRRIGSEVHFVAYIGKNTGGAWSIVPNVPTGFRPISANLKVSYTSGGECPTNVALVASEKYLVWNVNGDPANINDTVGIFYGANEVRAKNMSRGGWVSLRWPTDNAYPAVLPGTPA